MDTDKRTDRVALARTIFGDIRDLVTDEELRVLELRLAGYEWDEIDVSEGVILGLQEKTMAYLTEDDEE